MKTFLKYFYEILAQFFSGFILVISAIFEGIGKTFNIKAY